MLTLSTRKCNITDVPRASAPKPYHHGNLHEALLNASLDLIQEKGVRALTLREIGARLQVSRTAPYRHFPSKADLLAAISRAGFAQLAVELKAAEASALPGFASRMDAMSVAYVRFACEHRAHYEVMFGAESLPEEQEAPGVASEDRAFGILQHLIEEGQRAGEVRPGDPVQLALLAWSLVHGISMLGISPELLGTKPEQFTKFCSEALRTGLGTNPTPLDARDTEASG